MKYLRNRSNTGFLAIVVVAAAWLIIACPTGNDPNDAVDDGTPDAEAVAGEITAFSFTAALNDALEVDVEGTIGDGTIEVTVPYATSRLSLVPTVTHTGQHLVPASETAQDFRSPGLCVVIGEDGSTNEYTVTVGLGDPPSTVPVFKTGQATKYLTGDDGDLQAGRAWPTSRFVDNGDGTITDEMTGLMWQKDPDENEKSWAGALTYADGSTVGGYEDWRLPNILEMESILNYDIAWASPNTQADWLESVGFSTAVEHDRWWSSTTVAETPTYAYHMFIHSGGIAVRIDSDLKTNDTWYRAILVRGSSDVLRQTGAGPIDGYTLVDGEDGQLQTGVPWPSPRFTDNGDNTVTDNLTGLVWEQSVSTTGVNLEGALAEVDDFGDGGHLDWRLPNTRELMSLAHFGETDMAAWLNGAAFDGVVAGTGPGEFPWSSTRQPGTDPTTSGLATAWAGGVVQALYRFGTGVGVSAVAWPVRGGE